MNYALNRVVLVCAIVMVGVQWARAVPVAPSAPVAGFLYDETYDGFGSAVHDSFGTMNGTLAQGGSSTTAPGPGGPTTAPDVPFPYSGNTSFSTIGGPGGSATVWHATFGQGPYRTLTSGAPAVTVSAWLKYVAGSLSANTDANTNARKNNANAFLALTIDGNAASGGSGLYLNLPFGTAPDTTDNTNKLLVGGTSIAADGFLSYTTTGTLIPDQWNHIVGILDFANDQIRVSINGGAFETAPAAFGADVLTPGIDGGSPDIIPSRSFRSEYIGLLDEVAIWKTALNSDNVEWLHTNSFHSLVPIAPGGDYNGNGVVDAADYVLWRKSPSDFHGDPGGYTRWRGNFGNTGVGNGAASQSSSVPEPTAYVLALLGCACLTRVRRSPTRTNR